MAVKVSYEQALVAHGWVALDPVDTGVIEKLFKKDIREGEERLMLAVLENAVEYFQKYVPARNPSGKKLSQEAEEWFLEKGGQSQERAYLECDSAQRRTPTANLRKVQ
jgi:hypothetical protein